MSLFPEAKQEDVPDSREKWTESEIQSTFFVDKRRNRGYRIDTDDNGKREIPVQKGTAFG